MALPVTSMDMMDAEELSSGNLGPLSACAVADRDKPQITGCKASA